MNVALCESVGRKEFTDANKARMAVVNILMNDGFKYPHYPLVVNETHIKLLCVGRKIKGYKIALLIHDSIGLWNNQNEKNPLLIKLLAR